MMGLTKTYNIPSSPTPYVTPSNKRVRFSSTVAIRKFNVLPNRKNYQDLWYSPKEIQKRRRKEIQVINCIRQSTSPNKLIGILQSSDDWTDRGLEPMLHEKVSRSQNKLRAVLAVLMEQDRQDMEGVSSNNAWNVEEIARQYRPISQSCGKAALARAMTDYEEAMRIQQDVDRSSARKPPAVDTAIVVSRTNPHLAKHTQVPAAMLAISSRAA